MSHIILLNVWSLIFLLVKEKWLSYLLSINIFFSVVDKSGLCLSFWSEVNPIVFFTS